MVESKHCPAVCAGEQPIACRAQGLLAYFEATGKAELCALIAKASAGGIVPLLKEAKKNEKLRLYLIELLKKGDERLKIVLRQMWKALHSTTLILNTHCVKNLLSVCLNKNNYF